MKAVIIYYSFSGNTKEVTLCLKGYLEQKGYSAEICSLKPLVEPKAFFQQGFKAFLRQRPSLEEVNYDLHFASLICIGSPVWAFSPAPAINTYLQRCFGLTNKKAIIFTTYGSGVGNSRCLKYMEGILYKKGIAKVGSFSVADTRVKDKEFVYNQIKDAFLNLE